MRNPDNLLEPGCYYHVYNRGNNRENLFKETRNYYYFLELWGKYIEPIAETYAYCLLKNHFHALIRIREFSSAQTCEVSKTSQVYKNPNQQFSNLFNAYAKAINKAYERDGSLFRERFNRIRVDSEDYFTNLVYYIHHNPQKHGFVADFREYPYSSYHSILSEKSTKLRREELIAWFGNRSELKRFHDQQLGTNDNIKHLIDGDN